MEISTTGRQKDGVLLAGTSIAFQAGVRFQSPHRIAISITNLVGAPEGGEAAFDRRYREFLSALERIPESERSWARATLFGAVAALTEQGLEGIASLVVQASCVLEE